jgi:hypothetical protein
MVPLEQLLTGVPAVVLSERGAARAGHGNVVGPDDLRDPRQVLGTTGGARVRLLDGNGGLVGLAEPTPAGLLHPVVVLV